MIVKSGKQVVVPVSANSVGRIDGIRMDSIEVKSVHGNVDAIDRLVDAIDNDSDEHISLFYINKEKTTKVIRESMTNSHGCLQHLDGYIHSIYDTGSPVKEFVKATTDTMQFKRWFGDWQNDPQNASKVVNADGTPKVVYHGTNVKFTIFNSTSGLYWFSEYEDYAEEMAYERGGKNVMGVYLNMRNPYMASLPANQFSNPNYEAEIIRKAKAGNYDGIILKNDTDNELAAETFYIVFEPTQIKSATDNIGTFDGSNPDIRYSSRNNQDRQLDRLSQQNARLQQEAEYLKQLVKIQKTGNRDHVLDRNSVRKQAEKLMASANAKGNVDEISGLLNDFYHRMGTDAEITWDTMQEGAGEIADWLLEHHKPEMDEYAQSVLDFLKKRRVRLNESQIGDIEYSYGYHAAGIFAAAEGVRKQ